MFFYLCMNFMCLFSHLFIFAYGQPIVSALFFEKRFSISLICLAFWSKVSDNLGLYLDTILSYIST